MINDSIYKNVVEYSKEAYLFAQPEIINTEILDFRVIYMNDSCAKLSGFAQNSTQLLSNLFISLSSTINWKDESKKTFLEDKPSEQIFYSPNTDSWLKTEFLKIPDNLLLVTLKNVSNEKEHEQILRRQNLRLAALSEELVLSRQNLKNKLEKIENLNTKLEHLAYYDTLTDLPNRTLMVSNLKKTLDKAEINNYKVGLILIDIDNLKNINDSRGHNAGDELLKVVSRKLKALERDTIHCYRFGGDEFLVVVDRLESKDFMVTIADTVLESMNAVDIKISSGISLYPDDTKDMDELFKYADMAMYEVKKKGKNNSFFFQHLMQEKFLERLDLETKLSSALNADCFQLYFQPQVDIISNKLRGFEALLRWHDDELGWISPDQFIPLAEESRLVIPLGEWVMDSACSVLAEWQKKYDFKGIMSVNVSPIQLKSPTFLFDLEHIIKRHKIEPKYLEIEITEGILIENMNDTVAILNQIKNLGIGISLDDFGTGYSSLSYLQILPLNTLKIDKSFIANITSKNSVEAEITDAIISLVTKMGLDTIAEGVENKEQLSVLQQINCRNTQGFLMGKPMPLNLCERMLSGDESAILRTDDSALSYKL